MLQLGQLGERGADVTGADVRKRLGDHVDGLRGDAEREPGIAQRVAGAVGLGHAGDRDPLLAEAFEDAVVHLQPARGLHVDVDVRQRRPALG